jgi:hypothetical protein
VPPMTYESTIHDNACGSAIVTFEILSQLPLRSSAQNIKGTDISDKMIAAAERVNLAMDGTTRAVGDGGSEGGLWMLSLHTVSPISVCL